MLVSSACSTAESRARDEAVRHMQWLESAARTTRVDASDGISEVEAYVIGLEHYAKLNTACGAVCTPRDDGEFWRVAVLAGYAGLLVEELVIKKSDGTVIAHKPSYQKPPNKPSQPTAMPVTPPAGQESRRS